ncbi:MmcQ/YjbR family DNA-binding protein [Corynebacterium stationis]|uniref:MmcQ/YjbR family DNA-binding protein n=1 Tax=Corynebacterium stationis TaxID=1705 RepID=UPI00273B798A|nr:MmcQ/YjbR family DNA-binding protein [Corynebacterium stationis]WLP86292.1 MmcQ/YjbR family DNA-binding protein [Corynebacterium stationis]
MDGKDLHERAAAWAQELPGTELTHPFGPDFDVWKIRGKMFLFLTVLDGEPIVNLKAEPLDSEALRSTHQDITPGWHMNKKHWITIRPDGTVDALLFDELVTDSYLLVVEKLPKKKQPVDPQSFARGN